MSPAVFLMSGKAIFPGKGYKMGSVAGKSDQPQNYMPGLLGMDSHCWGSTGDADFAFLSFVVFYSHSWCLGWGRIPAVPLC